MKRTALASAVLASMLSVPVLAQDGGGNSEGREGSVSNLSRANPAIADRYYVSPMGSHVWEDKDRETDDGWGGVLAIGKQFSTSFSAEVSAFFHELHTDGNSDSAELMGLGVSGLFFPFSGSASQSVYGIVGGHYGDVKSHPSSGDEDYDTFFGNVGFGFLYGPFSWLNQGSIRAEALYRVDFHDKRELGAGGDDQFADGVVNLGLLIPIGAQPQPPPPPEPPPVEVVPVAAPVDSDGDGVPDDLDQCPGTPAGEAVNEVGCPLPKKECKTPEPGQPVTLEGCAAGDKIVLRGVNFEYDKARLTTNAKTILDNVSSALELAPTVTVELGGHTDSKGSDEYNMKLSDRRAASVKQYLVGKGIDAGRMTSAGYGETEPVADNETDEGRELNRRVELKVTGGSTESTPAAAAPAPEAAPAAEAAPTDAAPPAADAPMADAPPAEVAP